MWITYAEWSQEYKCLEACPVFWDPALCGKAYYCDAEPKIGLMIKGQFPWLFSSGLNLTNTVCMDTIV